MATKQYKYCPFENAQDTKRFQGVKKALLFQNFHGNVNLLLIFEYCFRKHKNAPCNFIYGDMPIQTGIVFVIMTPSNGLPT